MFRTDFCGKVYWLWKEQREATEMQKEYVGLFYVQALHSDQWLNLFFLSNGYDLRCRYTQWQPHDFCYPEEYPKWAFGSDRIRKRCWEVQLHNWHHGLPLVALWPPYWEVDLGNMQRIDVGICKKSVHYHRKFQLPAKLGFWIVDLRNRKPSFIYWHWA